MTRTVTNKKTKEVDELRKKVRELESSLSAVRKNNDIYMLTVTTYRSDDMSTLASTNRTFYHSKKDAVHDLNWSMEQFFAETGEQVVKGKTASQPVQLSPGTVELTHTRNDGATFSGLVTRIKVI